MVKIVYPQLEQDSNAWQSHTGPDINPVDSLAFLASNLPDGRLKVTNAGDKDYAGGLVANKLPVPDLVGVRLPWLELSMYLTVPATSGFNLARLETDLKVAYPGSPNSESRIPNMYEGSTQWNAETGTFQINTGRDEWTETGIGPSDIEVDVEHSLRIRYYFDFEKKLYSVVAILWDGDVFPIPGNLQNIPALLSNWEEVAAIQLQNELFTPGSTELIYRNIQLAWSDTEWPETSLRGV